MSDSLQWFKSSYSGSSGGDCIEIAIRPSTVHVRDSKDPDGPNLEIPTPQWASFVTFAANHRP